MNWDMVNYMSQITINLLLIYIDLIGLTGIILWIKLVIKEWNKS